MIYHLEKSLRWTQLVGVMCLTMTTCTIAIVSHEVDSIRGSLEELDNGFESAGTILVEGLKKWK